MEPSSSPNSIRPTSASRTFRVEITLIDAPTRTNGRIELDPDHLHDLTQSLASLGQLHPVTLRPHNGRYQLIAGHRRYLAARALGWQRITATILDMNDDLADRVRLAENALRQQLTPIEEALQLAPLVERNAQGVDGVAAALNRSPTWILDRLELLDMPDALQKAIHAKDISIAAAKRLARISPPELREQRIRDAIHHGINAKTAALWLQDSQRAGTCDFEGNAATLEASPPTFVSATLALCFVCNAHKALDDTQSVRVCSACHRDIGCAMSMDTGAPTK